MAPGATKSGAAPAPPRNLIPIPLPPGPRRANGPDLPPEQVWLNYYKKNTQTPQQLREAITLLNLSQKFREVRAMLLGYLTYHSKNAEPWMYEALALSIRMNGGSAEEARKSLGYAADLAERTKNPNHLVSVADQMFLLEDYDRVGKLLDQAIPMVPHRGEPLLMSINLAQKTRDPKRMGDAVERLLALGWPDMDEVVRRDARKQVETLAKALREDGRAEEADALVARLPDAEARDLFLRLTWVGDADLDLVIEEPLGAVARYVSPRTVFGGSLVKNGYGKNPEEVYVCPRGFDGDYTVKVETVYNNPERPALEATLEIIQHEGTASETKETRRIKLGKVIEPVKVTLKGGRRKEALPFVSPTVAAPRILVKPRTAPATKGATPPANPEAKPAPARR